MENSRSDLVATDLPDVVAVAAVSEPAPETSRGLRITRRQGLTVAVLLFVNLINYMDRFTVAAVMDQLQPYFSINDAQGGLLQTVFVCVFMITAPAFGYLGDRYNRKLLLTIGLAVWSFSVLISTFVTEKQFWLFALCRALVGIGESSYVTIGPTIIADMFAKDMRSRILMIYYFAIPVGSGLGFVIGGNMARATGQWQWGLRLTPICGALSLFLIWFVLQDPERGSSEVNKAKLHVTSWVTDLKHLAKCKSYVWAALASVCVTFVTGALTWWAPVFAVRSQQIGRVIDDPAETRALTGSVNLVFGILTCGAGFIGVTLGTLIANYWRRFNPSADALICAWSVLASVPLIYLALNVIQYSLVSAWALIFFGMLLCCFNWAKLPDIIMYTNMPHRRSTANAIMILFSHLFGDAASPYLIGLISDSLRGESESRVVWFRSLMYAMYTGPFMAAAAAFCFFSCALYVAKDRQKIDLILKGIGITDEEGNLLQDDNGSYLSGDLQ